VSAQNLCELLLKLNKESQRAIEDRALAFWQEQDYELWLSA
jgi:hypothetical protein